MAHLEIGPDRSIYYEYDEGADGKPTFVFVNALTGNTGREGGGLQTTQLPDAQGIFKYVFAGLGPRLRIAAIAYWDYATNNGKANNERIFGKEYAEYVDQYYSEAQKNFWVPIIPRRCI